MNTETKQVIRWLAWFAIAYPLTKIELSSNGWWGLYTNSAFAIGLVINMYVTIRLIFWIVRNND